MPRSVLWHAVVAAIAFGAGAGSAAAQGFDCGKARQLAEETVCAVPRLGAMDEELNRLYFALPPSVRGDPEVRRQRSTFFEMREGCGDDESCIASEYFIFINFLRRF